MAQIEMEKKLLSSAKAGMYEIFEYIKVHNL